MRTLVIRSVTRGLPLVLAAVLLFLAFRGVDWQAMGKAARRGHPVYLALGFVGFTTSFFFRALRWRVLLRAKKVLPRLTVFWATCVGYLANNVLPARAGELIRSALLGRATSISTGYVLATAMTERIMDLAALVLISLAALVSLPGMPAWLLAACRVLAIVAGLGIAFLFLAPRFEGVLRALLERAARHVPVVRQVMTLLEQFLLGMRALHNPMRGLRFTALTILIWLTDGFVAILIARAFDLRLTPPQSLLLLAALGLASAAPSTPGYIGIYQFVAVTVLVPFGFARSQALLYILAFQATIYAVVLVWGTLGLWRLHAESRSLTALTHVPTAE